MIIPKHIPEREKNSLLAQIGRLGLLIHHWHSLAHYVHISKRFLHWYQCLF
jgi:hypothetical protein